LATGQKISWLGRLFLDGPSQADAGHCRFAKHGTRYLGAFSYRFDRRFHLDTIPSHLLAATGATPHALAPSG
jgi:hypothetical protein